MRRPSPFPLCRLAASLLAGGGLVAIALLTGCGQATEAPWTTARAVQTLRAPESREQAQVAWDHLKYAANRGDTEAMYRLALHYGKGGVVAPDQEKSGYWLGKAARAGHAAAQADLALMIFASARQGDIPREQLSQATVYLEQAAEQGEPRALDRLGSLYVATAKSEVRLQEAANLFQRAASQGHPPAMVHLATLYFNGQGVEKDVTKGLELLKKAADAGDLTAAYRLSEIYLVGGPVKADQQQARLWLEKAANSGRPEAVHRLAGFYLRHRKDNPALTGEALALLNQTAAQGYPPSQFLLGRCYLVGHGVELNPATAAKWFRLAASQGHAESMTSLAVLQQAGVEKVPAETTQQLLRRAAERGDPRAHLILFRQEQNEPGAPLSPAAREHLAAAVEAKFPPALFEMGRRLIAGDGVKPDGGEGYRLLRLAGAQGHTRALRLMGEMFRDGGTVKQNPAKALALLETAAQNGEAEAALQAAMMLEQSEDPRHWEKARGYLELAARSDLPPAQSRLARLLLTESGGPPDPARAKALLEAAYAKGDMAAASLLGEVYQQGLASVTPSPKRAAAYYREAAASGVDDAAFRLVGLIEEHGESVGSSDEAIRLLKGLAQNDYPGAIALLGECQLEGKLTRKDLLAALRTFQRGAQRQDPGSLYQLGLIYEAGRGVEGDPIRAARYYRDAATLGHPGAQLNLGVMYLHGYGVGQDSQKARELLTKAKQAGLSQADEHLRQIR